MSSEVLLHLSLINGIGPVTCKKIITAWYSTDELHTLPQIIQRGVNDLTPLYSLSHSDCMTRLHLREKEAHLLVEGLRSQELLIQEKKLIEKEQCKIVTWFDESYPFLLLATYAPPPVLYVHGSLECLQNNRAIAVIGSRKAHAYAYEVTTTLVHDLVDRSWTIVSGGALGVDTIAHQSALERKGKTVVVLGSGLCYPYPYENRSLFKKIVDEGGAIISSFPLATKPQPSNFPARNRIIAGLSKACLVTAAAEKSGALISAHYALEEGRSVFAVPGLITDALSAGCHGLIKQGARLVHSSNDIFEELGESVTIKPESSTPLTKSQSQPTVNNPLLAALSEPLSLDELSIKVGLSFSLLQEQLFDLQLEGRVKQNFAGLWERN